MLSSAQFEHNTSYWDKEDLQLQNVNISKLSAILHCNTLTRNKGKCNTSFHADLLRLVHSIIDVNRSARLPGSGMATTA